MCAQDAAAKLLSRAAAPEAAAVGAAPRKGRGYTMTEVAKHSTPESCWTVVEGKVYDVTAFLKEHPGGERAVLALAGVDASEAFVAMHPPMLRPRLERFRIGHVEAYESTVSPIAKEWRELVSAQEQSGNFKTRGVYYVREMAKCLGMLLTVVVLVLRNSDAAIASTRTVAAAGVLLGLFWQQIAFFGHDVGHNSVRGIRAKSNYHLGIFVGNILQGVSIGWWKSTHNVHHVVCNSATHDPDIQHLPLLCVSEKIFNVFSQYHYRTFTLDYFARLAVMAQWLTYYPVMMIARINLYAQGIVLLVKERHTMSYYKLFTEWAGLAVFVTWYSLLVAQLPTVGLKAVFCACATATCALLHDQIALSHWSRPVFSGRPSFGSWFEHQLSGTLNITCPPWMDWMHGGLQFQIEHHLFPRLPRHNLRKVKPVVEEFAERHGVQYHDIGFVQANMEILQTMWDTGVAAKAASSAV
jgi:delta8-fatty-acid desaturase